jgi:hypothetical protein
MQKINSAASLREAILQLESRQADEGKILKDQFHLAYESVKPVNLIKNTLKQAAASVDLKENLLNTSLGLTAGYLSKKLFESTSNSPFKKLFGSALMFAMTNLTAKNPEAIKSLGLKFLKIIRTRQDNRSNEKTISKT